MWPKGLSKADIENRRIIAWLQMFWFAYLAIGPFYFFPSGLPQIADMIVFVGAFIGCVSFALTRSVKINIAFASIFLFVLMTFVINLTNYAFINHPKFIFSSIYYAYNFLVFAFGCLLFRYDSEGTRRISIAGIYVALILELIFMYLGDSRHILRETGSFNNPNQYGYWALLCVCSLFVLVRPHEMGAKFFLFAGLASYMALLSLSKAAIICVAMMWFFAMLLPSIQVRWKFYFVMATMVAFTYQTLTGPQMSLWDVINNVEAIESAVSRLEGIGEEGDDTAEGRGYDRIWNNPEYLLFGAGEGGYQRFAYRGKVFEMHSGLATILFSYSIFGFACFATFIYLVFKGGPISLWVTLAPIIAYGLTHQNVRFTMFWAFLAMAYGARNQYILGQRSKPSVGSGYESRAPAR